MLSFAFLGCFCTAVIFFLLFFFTLVLEGSTALDNSEPWKIICNAWYNWFASFHALFSVFSFFFLLVLQHMSHFGQRSFVLHGFVSIASYPRPSFVVLAQLLYAVETMLACFGAGLIFSFFFFFALYGALFSFRIGHGESRTTISEYVCPNKNF